MLHFHSRHMKSYATSMSQAVHVEDRQQDKLILQPSTHMT